MSKAENLAKQVFKGSGAYRRVYSLPKFSYMSAEVYLPSSKAADVGYGDKDNETAFIYAGGWGSSGQAVDAGFQHSPTFDNWSLFMKLPGKGEVEYQGPRMKSDQMVKLTFRVSAPNVLEVTARGVTMNNREETLKMQIGPADGVDGWNPDGVDQVLKRMTSIAQNHENFKTGSFIKRVEWKNAVIGTSAQDAHPWLSAGTGGFMSYPEDARVSVVFVDQANETDSINLS